MGLGFRCSSVLQTWTSAARRTFVRVASVPTLTAPLSAFVLLDTGLAQILPPALVRGSSCGLPVSPAFLAALPPFSLLPSPLLVFPDSPASSLAPRLPSYDFPASSSDIDECRERGPSLCGSQRCENSPGSYRCVRDCDPGYHPGPEGTCDGKTDPPKSVTGCGSLLPCEPEEKCHVSKTWKERFHS